MRTKAQVLRRIRILYDVFTAVLVASIVAGIMGRDFRTGFKEGYEAGISGNYDFLHERHHHYLEVDLARNGEYTIPIAASADSSLVVRGRVNMLDIEVQSKSAPEHLSLRDLAGSTLIMLSALMYGAVFVLLFLILNSLHRSSKTDNVFARRNVARTRWIGILLIAASVFGETGIYLDALSAAELLRGTPYAILPGVPVAFGELIMGIMMLFVAEIFNVGYDMAEEEQLTI